MFNSFSKTVCALGWVSVFSMAVIIGFFLAIDGQERYLTRKRNREIDKTFDDLRSRIEAEESQ